MRPRLATIVLGAAVLLSSEIAVGGDPLSFEHSTHLAPSDYLLGSRQERADAVFDSARAIDLGVDLGIGSDCGKIDFRSTLRSTLKNMLDSKYFGDLGRDVVAGSPMLLACYFSPTWCAILKHTQLNANFLSQMRLSQCSLIDKYTDSRVEDFERERQACVRQHIQDKGGDLESAMESCQNVWGSDLSSWTSAQAGKVSTNQLIESSAKWAGFDGAEAQKSVDMLKSMIGDTVVSQGKVSVDFGPKGQAATPATHLAELQSGFQKSVCDGLLAKVRAAPQNQGLDQVVTNADLRAISGTGVPLVDRQTIESLAFLPKRERELGCRRLADALGLTVFTKDLNRSLDILTAAAQNPNLPPNRRQEIDEKRRMLKESVDLTLSLSKERDGLLDQVEAQINEAGDRARGASAGRAVASDMGEEDSESARLKIFDCSDNLLCGGQ